MIAGRGDSASPGHEDLCRSGVERADEQAEARPDRDLASDDRAAARAAERPTPAVLPPSSSFDDPHDFVPSPTPVTVRVFHRRVVGDWTVPLALARPPPDDPVPYAARAHGAP